MQRHDSSADLQHRLIYRAGAHQGMGGATYATLRMAYEHLMGEMPHDLALFDVG